MNERIKEVRKYYKLTQQKFAERLGLKQNTVASYEINRIDPSDAVIISICREFNINEEWLRYGQGSMLSVEYEFDELSTYFADLTEGKDPRIVEMLLKYRKLSPQHKQALWEIYDEFTKKEDA